MREPEKQHIIQAFSFELGKVKSKSIKQKRVDMFANVSTNLANSVANHCWSFAFVWAGFDVRENAD